VHAWQLTDVPRYRQVVEETLTFIERDMVSPDGGFISSLDADTDGEEGATYVWTKQQIDAVLGEGAPEFSATYGVTEAGNWEGKTILSRVGPGDEERLAAARRKLFEVRQQRAQPARDDKVLTAWNGLGIAALADAARAMANEGWAQTAARAAELLLSQARTAEGRLFRSYKAGRARQTGVLEDYANLADGLLALYQSTFEERWFVAARELADHILAHFADPTGGFFDTADDHETLIARPKSVQDNATPSGNAMAASVLLQLAALTGDGRYRTAAEGTLRLATSVAARYPTGFGHWLTGFQLALGPLNEVAVVGERLADDTRALLAAVNGAFRPAVVLAYSEQPDASAVPLLHDRVARAGRATAYVCQGFACRQPVSEPAELEAQLSSSRP
jgi:hypothetical protein